MTITNTRRALIGLLVVAALYLTGPDHAEARPSWTPWRSAVASVYGPGLYGNTTACGKTLRRWTLGVAHKTLPCGTRVLVRSRGRRVIVRVIDRGPYVGDREFDLTEATTNRLGYRSWREFGVRRIGVRVARR